MSEQVIDVSATSAATPQQVWALLSEPATWSEWGAWSSAGPVPPDSLERGVGSRREFATRGVKSLEEVTEFEPGARLGYKLISGLPLRDYHGLVTLTPLPEGGTEIRWQSHWQGRPSDLFFRRPLKKFIADTASRLAAAASDAPAC